MILYIISFILGALSALVVSYFVFIKKYNLVKEDFIKLKSKTDASDELQTLIKRDFVQLANDTIKQEQEDLRKQNREALEEKLSPLTKELDNFKKQVEEFNLKGVENTAIIKEQIENLEKNNKTIQQEAKNLTEALTKNQNVKGSYGEDLLDTILQSCGMTEGVHYNKQYVTSSDSKNGENHTIRPDIVVNLPDGRHLIIDSKVTLTSYLDYIDDDSKISEFKTEVKKRITDLANKNYHNAEGLYQPDFVLMYMPIESSVNMLYEDSDIINLAYKSNIIIVGTASLLTAIRLVNQLLAQKRQQESVGMIVKAGSNLYDTFVQFCDDLIDLQKKFGEISSKFTTTINRFSRNSKNKPSLFSQVNTLKEFGIISTKEIPSEFLKDTDDFEVVSGELVND